MAITPAFLNHSLLSEEKRAASRSKGGLDELCLLQKCLPLGQQFGALSSDSHFHFTRRASRVRRMLFTLGDLRRFGMHTQHAHAGSCPVPRPLELPHTTGRLRH